MELAGNMKQPETEVGTGKRALFHARWRYITQSDHCLPSLHGLAPSSSYYCKRPDCGTLHSLLCVSTYGSIYVLHSRSFNCSSRGKNITQLNNINSMNILSCLLFVKRISPTKVPPWNRIIDLIYIMAKWERGHISLSNKMAAVRRELAIMISCML